MTATARANSVPLTGAPPHPTTRVGGTSSRKLSPLAGRGKAILYSSHILEVVEKVCDRILVLHRGDVVADDSIESLRSLLSSNSLEGVFAQLVIREDPEKLARDLADLSSLSA
jgi:ABC-type multidrug transport system ATPase subunit